MLVHMVYAVCPSVRPLQASTVPKGMAKRRIMQTMPHDSPGSLVLGCQNSRRNSNMVTPYGTPYRGQVG